MDTFSLHMFDDVMQTKVKKIDPDFNRQATMSLLYSAHCGDLAAIKRWPNTVKVHHDTNTNITNSASRVNLLSRPLT